MNKNIKYLLENIYKFNPGNYIDDEEDIVSPDIIDAVMNIKYPVFPGSNEILDFLEKYEWHKCIYNNDYRWKKEKIKCLLVSDAMTDNTCNMFYALLKSLYINENPDLIPEYDLEYTVIYKTFDNKLHIFKYTPNDDIKIKNYLIIGKYEHGQGISKKSKRFCIYQTDIKPYAIRYGYDIFDYFFNTSSPVPGKIAISPYLDNFLDNKKLPDIYTTGKLADFLEMFIDNMSKMNTTITEDLLYFNPIEYNNDDNDLIDNDTINDIIYGSLPKFTGSEKLKKILMSFDWKEQKPSHYKETDIIGLLYAKGYKNPIQRFLSFIGKYAKSGWVQYMDPSQWMSDEYKYSMIYAFSKTKFVITEHIGKENQFYGNSVVIEEVSSKKEGSTIILSSYKKTVGKPNHFMSIYAPIELYAYLRDFIKLYTDNHVNENLYDFDVTDYENDDEDLIDRLSLKQLSKYMPKYNFEGAEAILLMLNSLTWYETDGHEYDYFTPNTKLKFTVYQPIIKSTSTKFELGLPHSYNWILDMIYYFDILKGACWEKLNNKSERVLNNMPHTKIWILHRDGPDGAYSPTCDIGVMFAEHLGKNKEGRTCFITLSHPNYKWEDALLISFLGHRWDNMYYCNRLIYAPVELTDMLSSFIRYITGNEVEINENTIKFNPIDYNDNNDDIIDSLATSNILFNDLPKFNGSEEIKKLLLKYNWEDHTEYSIDDSLINDLYAESPEGFNFIYKLLDIFSNNGWIQYYNENSLKNNRFCCVSFSTQNEIHITEYNGKRDEYITPRACVIKEISWFNRKNRLIILIHNNLANYARNLYVSLHAPIELFDFFKKFADHFSSLSSINENHSFDIIDYSDSPEDNIVDSTEIDNITYKNMFPGGAALLNILREHDWIKMTTEFLSEDAYLGIISRTVNFDEVYNEIKECILPLKHEYKDVDNYCSVLFDDRFPRLPKKIIIQEHLGYGNYGEFCVISGAKNDNINIRFLPTIHYNFGRRIKCDVHLISLLKEFVEDYE